MRGRDPWKRQGLDNKYVAHHYQKSLPTNTHRVLYLTLSPRRVLIKRFLLNGTAKKQNSFWMPLMKQNTAFEMMRNRRKRWTERTRFLRILTRGFLIFFLVLWIGDWICLLTDERIDWIMKEVLLVLPEFCFLLLTVVNGVFLRRLFPWSALSSSG